MTIRKFPGQQKYGLYAKSSGRRLGTFPTKAAAVKRERQIQFFKHRKR